MSLPKLIGMFRLTRDCELKYSKDGKPILKMGLVSSEKFGDHETQCFTDATVFGKMAETINSYAGAKGTQIFLTGKMQTESWEKDGQRHYKNSMIVEGFDFVGNKDNRSGENSRSHYTNTKKPAPREMPRNDNSREIEIDDDSIPF